MSLCEWSSEETGGDRSAGEEGGEENGEEEAGGPGEGNSAEEEGEMMRADSVAGAAAYWDGLLRAHWQALEREEGGALAGRMGACARACFGYALSTPRVAHVSFLPICMPRRELGDGYKMHLQACWKFSNMLQQPPRACFSQAEGSILQDATVAAGHSRAGVADVE